MTKLPYQQLKIWQKGIHLTLCIYQITKNFPKEEIFVLTPQMRRSAISVPSNIAEGSQRKTNKDFSHFLSIALGSLVELETQSIIAREMKYMDQKTFDDTMNQIDELKKMIYAFSKKLES